MQPLLLLKQTIEAPYDPGALLLDGPNVSVTRIEQVLSRGEQQAKEFTAGYRLSAGEEQEEQDVSLTFGRAESSTCPRFAETRSGPIVPPLSLVNFVAYSMTTRLA